MKIKNFESWPVLLQVLSILAGVLALLATAKFFYNHPMAVPSIPRKERVGFYRGVIFFAFALIAAIWIVETGEKRFPKIKKFVWLFSFSIPSALFAVFLVGFGQLLGFAIGFFGSLGITMLIAFIGILMHPQQN